MTSTDNQADRRILLPPYSEADTVAELESWGRTHAPSRFMVYGIEELPRSGYDGEVIAWGLSFGDHVYVQAEGSTTGGTFTSIERMRRIMFRGDRDIRLLWIDPELPGTDPGAVV
jgi:hypothetical protein